MKLAEKKEPIQTIPDGAWEAGMIHEKKNVSEKKRLNEITTDAQGNGYPITNKQGH